MVECLPEAGARASASTSIMVSFRVRVVCFIQTFTLTSRSLYLPVGCQLISSISFEMFGCQPFFFQKSGTWFSPCSGLSDSTFLISSSSAFFFSSEVCWSLSISLTLAVRRCSSSAWASFYLIFSGPLFLDKEIEDWKPALDLYLFLVFQTIRMETYQLIIFSLLVGQWATSLPQFASCLFFGLFGSLLLRFLFLDRVYQFVAVPLAPATGLSGLLPLSRK